MQEKGLHINICQLNKTVRNNLESFHEFGNMQIIQRDLSNPSSMTKMEVTGTIFCQVMFNTTGDWWLFQVPQRNPHPCREDLLSVTFLLVSWEAFLGGCFSAPYTASEILKLNERSKDPFVGGWGYISQHTLLGVVSLSETGDPSCHPTWPKPSERLCSARAIYSSAMSVEIKQLFLAGHKDPKNHKQLNILQYLCVLTYYPNT